MMDTSRKPALVIFDCDGVLVDSEPVSNRVMHAYLTERGAQMTLQECCAQFIGKSMADIERYMMAEGVPLGDQWIAQCNALMFAALQKEVKPMSGIGDVLQKLHDNNVAFCVASNGQMAKMDVTLGTSGLLPWFRGNMFSAYDIGKSKPAPDVFLAAASANDVDPQNCVVIEDSATGMLAAQNAAMRCYAFVPDGQVAPEKVFGAHRFSAMRELPAVLGLT